MPVAGKESEKWIFKGIHYLLVILLLSTWELQSLTLTLCFQTEMGHIILNSWDVYCHRLKKLHVKEMIYPFIIDESIYESCVVKTLSQQRTSKSPSCCSSMSRETLRPWKKLFLNCSSNNTIIPGGKVPSESFPSPSFSRTSSPSSSSPASSCSSISVA